MQVSVIKYGNLERTKRLDSEYYNPKYLNSQAILNNKETVSISDVCKVSDGNHMSISSHFQEHSGIPYYRGQDINTDFFIENAQPIYIPEDVYEQSFMKRSIFKTGDVLLSIVGTIGSLSLVTENIQKSTGSCKLAILRPEKVCSEYLATFLMCSYGKQQVKRRTRGAVQMGLILEDMDQIQIWLAPEEFQRKISEVIQSSLEKNRKTKSYFTQAQTLLLSELGLLDLKPKHQLSFVKFYSDTQQAARFDAEYFQPKYDEIVRVIKNYASGWDTTKNIFNIKDKNISPKEKVGYKYIELANIGDNGEITGFMDAEGQDLPSRARRKVRVDDVIISSIEGSLSSIGLITDEYDGALCSTGFYVVDSDKINPQTLLVLLKSPIGQELLKKGCNGTILTAINKDEIGKIVLPIVDSEIQNKIQQKIIESFNLRKQSKYLLECAKKAVEMAIETDEETAIQWLESHINSIERGN